MIPQSLLRAYDIRGTFGEDLTVETARTIGQQFCLAIVKEKGRPIEIALGYDGRLSSPALKEAISQGIQEVGGNITDIGLCPTPMVSYAVRESGSIFDSGIMITGSHNPGHQNGFKLTFKDRPFYGKDIQSLAHEPESLPEIQHGTYKTDLSIQKRYAEHLLNRLPQTLSNFKGVIWDCGHGATGPITRVLSNALNERSIESRILFEKVDGTFPAHAPDPSRIENLEQLYNEVCNTGFLGLAFDGDGDRLSVVTKEQGLLQGEHVIWHIARNRLNTIHPKGTVLMDVKMSSCLIKLIQSIDGNPVLWKTGHAHIKSKMKEYTDLAFAGEASGHYFFPELGYDDGLYAACCMLKTIDNLDESLSLYPDSLITPECRLPCANPHQTIAQLQQYMKNQNVEFVDLDGVRVDTEKGWWIARASNTEAVVTVRIESFTKTLSEMVSHVYKILAHVLDSASLSELKKWTD